MPCPAAAYCLSTFERNVADAIMQKMIAQDVIEPSTSPRASEIVTVPHKGGSWGFLMNCTRLNKLTVKAVYPMPRVHDIRGASRSDLLHTLDIASG